MPISGPGRPTTPPIASTPSATGSTPTATPRPVSQAVTLTGDGFMVGGAPATNVPYAELAAKVDDFTPKKVLQILKAVDPSTISVADRCKLLRAVSKDELLFDISDNARSNAILKLSTVKTNEQLALANAMYEGKPGERTIDRVSKAIGKDDDADLKFYGALGKELRIARDRWGATYNDPDPTVRAQMGTTAASRKLMQTAFPFNDGPFSAIETKVANGKMTAILNGNPDVQLGDSFAVPATNEGVQAEVAKRFNTYYYGTENAPPAFLNSLIKRKIDIGSAHPGEALAKAVTRENGFDKLTLDAATWGDFVGQPNLSPAQLKSALVQKFGHYFNSFQAQHLESRIEIQGDKLVMPLDEAKIMVEAKQLNDKAKEFFANDKQIPADFDFVQRVGNKLRFVVPYELASAFDPTTEYKPSSPMSALNKLAERMTSLELGNPTLAGEGNKLLAFDMADAKRLMAASMFSYAGGNNGDLRNIYGGAQLANLAYMPFDSVASDSQGVYSRDNRNREIQKRTEGDVPVGALASKLARMGFAIEKEIATPLGQAFVARNDKLGLVRVVFRGSDRPKDFRTDAEGITQDTFTVDGKDYLAPTGMLASVKSTYPEIMKAVQSATDKLRAQGITDIKLGADGHSKGGAEAGLFSFMAQADIAKNPNLPKFEQINMIEPARSLGRWNPAGLDSGIGVVDRMANVVVGYVSEQLPGARPTNTAADVFDKTLGALASVWAMSRDVVPHLGLYGAGQVKPGHHVVVYDESSTLLREGTEQPVSKSEPAFVRDDRHSLRDQGVSFSSHMMGTVLPTIFGQIGSGTLR